MELTMPTSVREAAYLLLRIQALHGKEGYLSNALSWVDWHGKTDKERRLASRLLKQAAREGK